jgi:hypothetical protein
MGAHDLNEVLAKHLVKKGDPGRNPLGVQGTPETRRRARDIKADLWSAGSKPCQVPGFEHMSRYEYGIHNLMLQFMQGEKWAVILVLNRLFGRVPLDVEVTAAVTAQAQANVESMSSTELAARAGALRKLLMEDAKREAAEQAAQQAWT